MAVVLALWSGLARIAARGLAPAVAALRLIGHGIDVSVAGLDWILSLDPGFDHTIMGAQLAVMQMTLAMAATLAWGMPRAGNGDCGGLLLAGAPVPFAVLLVTCWHGNAMVLRVIAFCVLDGGLAQFVWLAAPGRMIGAGPAALTFCTASAAILGAVKRGGGR